MDETECCNRAVRHSLGHRGSGSRAQGRLGQGLDETASYYEFKKNFVMCGGHGLGEEW
jgi:hypothetical protein